MGMDGSKFDEIFGEDGQQLAERMGVLTMVLGPNGVGGLGTPITGDEVEFHDSSKIVLPKGMTFERAMDVFERLRRESETMTMFDRKFRYRPDDGAYATAQVIRERYGMSFGEAIHSMYGSRPPETRTIYIGVNESVQVPWGLISIPSLKGIEVYLCDQHDDPEYGKVFEIHLTAPRKYKEEIESFFEAIEQYLREHSIYRGKAVVGSDSPEFLDLSGFDADQIVFSDDVTNILDGTVWSVIRHTEALREEGLPRKKAVLLYGPYGTGKTSAGQLTAQIAVANGWTFISARPGHDRVEDVLRTARLYQPAVVFVEDIDTQASNGEDDVASCLLDAFDGITAKGGELVVVLTTNHLERIHKGMLRPGRLDAVVEINSLDRNGVERLIKAVVKPGKLADDIDFDAVHVEMEGFYPAFVRESLDRAVTFAINRLDGQRNYMLTTTDLVGAAKSLQPQLKALHDANEGEKRPSLVTALEDTLKGAMNGGKMISVFGGEPEYELSLNGKNGNGSHE